VVDLSFRLSSRSGAGLAPRRYRLIELDGSPHPVLDDLYDSLETAWEEARHWWQEQVGGPQEPVGIAIEVSTSCGSWRRLRSPTR
jgi:hypothetical protein